MIGAMLLWDAAQVPERVFEALCERLEAFTETERHRFHIRVGEYEVIDQVGEGFSCDGDAQLIHVGSNVYCVPSRLIGTKLLVRLHAQTIEGYVGTKLAFTLPRLVGTHQHRIDYHHFIWSLVRKPGAFAAYR